MNKSIKALFQALERSVEEEGSGARGGHGRGEKELFPAETTRGGDADAERTSSGMSPAEAVGRVLLDRLGGETGLSERELAQAILDVWEHPEKLPARSGEPALSFADEPAQEGPVMPFGEHRRLPKPIRSGAAAAQRIDYDELSDEQFRLLRKQLKKAEADGKKVRL